MNSNKKKIGIIFSGGPAPSANSVISACALSFLDKKISCIGFYRGYEFLEKFDKNAPNIIEGEHYVNIDYSVSKIRNEKGIMLKTSRANPGAGIKNMKDFNNKEKTQKLQNIVNALNYLNIDTLISIGGDDTLKTANFLKIMGVNVIHIPKTIDNDYFGIPWTFGFWTCVNIAKSLIINLEADAMSTDAFVIAELMGRKSGWITYATGIAGESIKMISTEDIDTELIDIHAIANEITDLIQLRQKMKRPYGVICIAEGLVEKLPDDMKPETVDSHGNIKLDKAQIGLIISDMVSFIYKQRTGKEIKIVNKQIGYETRAGEPISYDIVLGSMLGYGAYKLYSKEQFGQMVSVSDEFEIKGIPFQELIDTVTLLTKIRLVPKGSDFHNLKEILSYRDYEK